MFWHPWCHPQLKEKITTKLFICNSNLSTTFTKAANDVRDSGLSVWKAAQKWGTKNSTLQEQLNIHPRITICFVHHWSLSRYLYTNRRENTISTQQGGWHISLRQAFPWRNVVLSMYENWARCTKTGQLRSFGKNGIIFKHTSVKRPIVLHLEGK